MSMIGCFYALKDEDLEAVLKSPEKIHQLWSTPQADKGPSSMGRLFGVKPERGQVKESWQPSEKPVPFDVDKAWHAIHFLLTGSDWEGDGPLAFILHGGREISEDLGYGPSHGFTSVEVKNIDSALRTIKPEELYERADPAAFTRNEIYPQIWADESKDVCIGYVMEHFTGLQKFVSDTAQSGRGLIVYLG